MSEEMKKYLIDFLFPNRCPICGKVIRWDIEYSPECYENLTYCYTGTELCRGCGMDVTKCVCDEGRFAFSWFYAAYYYTDAAREAVIFLKQVNNRFFPDLVADKIRKDMERDDFAVNADFIIPVPMSRFKRERRGFNQAEIIAEALSEKLSVPVRTDTLKKHGSFVAQHKLKREKRQANVSHLYYKGNTENLEGKTVILVDDVVTTGSTLNECAKLLVSFGVKEIIAVAAATTLK